MGRLIDADKLLEETRRDRDYARKNGFLDMYYERQVLIDRIESQPTAFDMEKVVEELLALNKNYNDGINLYEEVAEIPTEEAIEIVKQGGVSDDVCEWELDGDNLITGCGDYFNTYDNCTDKFKYCPRCGKKIKAVE